MSFLFRSMFIKEKIEMINVLGQISQGMEFYNGLQTIKNDMELFRPVFTPSNMFVWEFELLCQMLHPIYSEEGSNHKIKEINAYKSFLDFLEASFKDGKLLY